MIRLMNISEIDDVMEIWKKTNFEVHDYIPQSYWLNNEKEVKLMMENANIYVSVDEDSINGFVGIMEGSYLAGIFVNSKHRGKGTGKALLDYVKERYEELTLSVYENNKRAYEFYIREGFETIESGVEEETGFNELTMAWPNTNGEG